MAMGETARVLLACVTGLLLGSVLPADLLARRRGIDIRSVGDRNPGTVNAVRALGWPAGLLTGFYDVLVGVAAIQIARLLGLSEGPSYLAGVMSVVGHRFPVFEGFRGGGQGMAASAGLLVYGITVALSRGWLSAGDIVILVAVVLVTFLVTRSDKAMALVVLPVLAVRLAVAHPGWQFLAFMIIVAGYIWVVQLVAVLQTRLSEAGRARQTHD